MSENLNLDKVRKIWNIVKQIVEIILVVLTGALLVLLILQ